ncbi:unnamed protein product [Ilex paraguariensis]|uniref:Uncharacterized protein n=1 Tax=Ilex paraguariensis TaxID=185542 RepID=A0ABC8R8A6_9AQUA
MEGQRSSVVQHRVLFGRSFWIGWILSTGPLIVGGDQHGLCADPVTLMLWVDKGKPWPRLDRLAQLLFSAPYDLCRTEGIPDHHERQLQPILVLFITIDSILSILILQRVLHEVCA